MLPLYVSSLVLYTVVSLVQAKPVESPVSKFSQIQPPLAISSGNISLPDGNNTISSPFQQCPDPPLGSTTINLNGIDPGIGIAVGVNFKFALFKSCLY